MPDYTRMTDEQLDAELANIAPQTGSSWAGVTGELDRRSRRRAAEAAEAQARSLTEATRVLAGATQMLAILTCVLALSALGTLAVAVAPESGKLIALVVIATAIFAAFVGIIQSRRGLL